VVLTHLVPGGAGRNLGADQAVELLRGVRARDAAAKTLRALAMDLISEVRQLDRRITKAANDIQTAVTASGTTLTDVHGVGTLTAAKILAHVGDVGRFRSAAAFATYTGTAPIEVSSGEVVRHRLSRAGGTQISQDARSAVDAVGGLVEVGDLGVQFGTLVPRWRKPAVAGLAPFVEPRPRHLQQPAHP
jgi:transposase